MSEANSVPSCSVQITFRIPGTWQDPDELIERLPKGFRMASEGLVMPDGSKVEAWPVPPDDQFSQIFMTAYRQPPTPDERRTIENYGVNLILCGPGGSTESAYKMMQAAAAIIDAGGAGVFIDNSAMSHGGQGWKELVEDGGPDAISFAFVSIMRGKRGLKTIGMHVLGYPDFELTSLDTPPDEDTIISVIQYVSSSDKPIGPGHVIIDENGPQFRVDASHREGFDSEHPMYNPFGYLKLVSVKEIAENN